MALINNLYIFVEDETLDHDIESSSYPVEKGIEITDHIQKKPVSLTLKGKIIDHDGAKASDILSKVKNLQTSGSLITYVGRNAVSNMQIQTFSTSHPYTNWGGCDFDMTLKEVRIANPAYSSDINNGGTQQIDKGENKNVYHNVKKGDTVWTLVTTTYKSLDPKFSEVMDKCNWVMENNPDAFSKIGDFRTLQIGKNILIGVRK